MALTWYASKMVQIDVLDDFHECSGKFIRVMDISGTEYTVFVSTTSYIWSTGEIGPLAMSVRSVNEPVFMYPMIGSTIDKGRIDSVSRHEISKILSKIEKGLLLMGTYSTVPEYIPRISPEEYQIMMEYSCSYGDLPVLKAIITFVDKEHSLKFSKHQEITSFLESQ